MLGADYEALTQVGRAGLEGAGAPGCATTARTGLTPARAAAKIQSMPPASCSRTPQAHCAVVAGACLAVGIRFAGSCNGRAEALLRKYCLHFLAAKQRAPEPGTGAWLAGGGALPAALSREECA